MGRRATVTAAIVAVVEAVGSRFEGAAAYFAAALLQLLLRQVGRREARAGDQDHVIRRRVVGEDESRGVTRQQCAQAVVLRLGKAEQTEESANEMCCILVGCKSQGVTFGSKKSQK